MKNNATHKFVSVENVCIEYKRLFKRDLNIYDALGHTFWALKKIGNYTLKDKLIKTRVHHRRIEIPCDCVKIHAIAESTPLSVFYTKLDAFSNYFSVVNGANANIGDMVKTPDTVSLPVDIELPMLIPYYVNDWNEAVKSYKGVLLDYKWEGGFAHVNHDNLNVDLIYQGIYEDKNGYPLFEENMLLAICHYANFVELSAKVFNGEPINNGAVQLAEQLMNQHIGQARVSGGFSAKGMDDVFNALSSHIRKQFNVQLMGL